MGVFFKFDVRGAAYQGFDVEGGKGDEIRFRLAGRVGRCEREEGMADLLDVDGAGEGGFLGVVALELRRKMSGKEAGGVSQLCAYLNAVFGICNAICCHRRVMADLLGNKLCLSGIILPVAYKELAQKWIQRFLLAAQFVASRCV